MKRAAGWNSSSPGRPLRTHLVAVPGEPVRDVIEGVVLEVRCSNGTVLDTSKGALMPTVGDERSTSSMSGQANWKTRAGGKATVTGEDWLKGPKGDERDHRRRPGRRTLVRSVAFMAEPVATP